MFPPAPIAKSQSPIMYFVLTVITTTQQYHPDDLKGKGEPSYTIEKSLKDHKQQQRSRGYSHGSAYPSYSKEGGGMIEMQKPRTTLMSNNPFLDTIASSNSTSAAGLMGDGGEKKEGNTRVRQRSVSNAAATGAATGAYSNGNDYYEVGGGESSGFGTSGVRRSNTTGKNIAQSLKRRLGSIRRKNREEV